MLETRTLDVKVDNPYRIHLGFGLERELQQAVSQYPKHRIAIISDETVANLHGKTVLSILKDRSPELITFAPGERNKNLRTFTTLQHTLTERRFVRDTLVLAFGGGVVGDMAGLVASTLAREVSYIQIPTTLLALVDSSVGGKTAVDTPTAKNSVGRFHQPCAVIADLGFLKTLPKLQVLNGLFEAIKMFITNEGQSLNLAKKLDLKNPLLEPEVLHEIVWRAVSIKAGVVQRDETEKNERKILNFGHTAGHAIEHLSGYRKPHGFCVALGMLAEARISERLGILSSNDADWLENYVAAFGIHRNEFRKYSIPDILAATRSDKKTLGGKPHYVLLESVGSVHIDAGQYAHPVTDFIVREVLRTLTR